MNGKVIADFGLVLCILSLVVLVSFLIVGTMVDRRQAAKKSIVTKAVKKLSPEYRINVYEMVGGTLVQLLWGDEVDSIFKVAQYAPSNFFQWVSRWQLFEKGAINREYWRCYEGDDGRTYAVLVGTTDGLWPLHAEQYLAHL